MRNLHVIPTGKPSRLLKQNNNKLILSKQIVYSHISKHLENINQNIYITNPEETKEGDCCLDKFNQIWKLENKKLIAFDSKGIKRFSTHNILGHEPKKIILTTDAYLIKDGVQAIPDEFLEWFVNNPSCEKIEVENIPNNSWGFDLEEPMNLGYKIIIPKEEPKQETLKEAAKNYLNSGVIPNDYQSFINSAKWQQEQDKNKYSEEEVIELLNKREDCINQTSSIFEYTTAKDWFEQFKKK